MVVISLDRGWGPLGPSRDPQWKLPHPQVIAVVIDGSAGANITVVVDLLLDVEVIAPTGF